MFFTDLLEDVAKYFESLEKLIKLTQLSWSSRLFFILNCSFIEYILTVLSPEHDATYFESLENLTQLILSVWSFIS